MVFVEKGPPTDLNQNANTWGGIPDHFGCSYKWYDSYASLNIAGTTRTEVIWGDTCSMGGSSGMGIAFIEQGHYVTAFIVGATTSAALSSDTTLSGILSGISFVTTKPDDVLHDTPTYATSTSGVTASGTMSGQSGTWATVCADASSVSSKPSDTTHIGFVIVITGSTTFTREINFYTDSACTNLSLGSYYNNTNFVEGDTSGSDTKISYTQALTFMAKTTAGETFIEAMLGSIDVTVDTAYEKSSGVPMYNLVKESSGDNFYFGAESYEAYPSTAGDVEFVKQ